jgi:hypothetical protein
MRGNALDFVAMLLQGDLEGRDEVFGADFSERRQAVRRIPFDKQGIQSGHWKAFGGSATIPKLTAPSDDQKPREFGIDTRPLEPRLSGRSSGRGAGRNRVTRRFRL